MTVASKLKKPFVVHQNVIGHNRAIQRANITVEQTNNLFEKARSLGFDLNDQEAHDLIHKSNQYHEGLTDCLQRTEPLKYSLGQFSKALAEMRTARTYYSPNVPNCFEIKDGKAALTKEFLKDTEEYYSTVVTTQEGLARYNKVKAISEQINDVLNQLSDVTLEDLFAVNEENEIIPAPLNYDNL